MNSLHSFDLWQLAQETHRARLAESERSRKIKRALADNIFEMDAERPAHVRIVPVQPKPHAQAS